MRRIEAHGIGPDGARARVRGSVSSLAAQLARWGGATVIGTVRGEAEARQVSPGAADHVVSLHSGPIPATRQVAPAGVDRIIEVALSAKADLDAAIVRNGAVLAAYASPKDRPELPFRPMLFANVTMRLLGSDDFPLRAKDAAARDLTHAAAQSALSITIAEIVPLAQIARYQELIESGRPQAGCSCRFPSAGRGRATRATGRPRSGYRPTPGLPPGQVLQPVIPWGRTSFPRISLPGHPVTFPLRIGRRIRQARAGLKPGRRAMMRASSASSEMPWKS